mgnify:CR=1 FL=1
MTILDRQKEIFNNFSNGDILEEQSKRYFRVKRNNKNNSYFLVLQEPKKQWENKYIWELTNDNRARFIMKWKTWKTNFILDNGEWRKGYVVVLNNANQWDKEIIDSWKELARGGEEILDLDSKKSIGVLKWQNQTI